MPSKKGLSHPLRVLRERDVCLLWVGQGISSLGSAFQVVALSWFILQKGSPTDLTIAMLALAIPQALLTLAGGVMTDRIDARTVVLWSDAARVLTTGLLALQAMIGAFQLWLLSLFLICHGAATGIFSPAFRSLAPRLVAKEYLDATNSLFSLASQLGLLLGVLPAGFLVAHQGPAIAFLLNSLSYVVAVGTALFMRPLERGQRRATSVWRDVWEGIHYVKTLPWLVTLLFMDAFMALAAAGSNSIGLPLLARNVLHSGAQGYSLLLWSLGCGTILGLIFPSLLRFRRSRGLICILFQCMESLLIILLAISPLPLAALCLLAWNMLNGVLIVLHLSLIQQHVEAEVIGRVTSLWLLASSGLLPLSQLSAGLITNAVGTQAFFVLAGSVVLAGGLLGGSVPTLRRLS
jgi:DHA3 family tetracycline resistance protein-like MFS transporter